MKSCVLLGHRDCPQNIRQKLYDTIENLILHCGVDVFYVGTHGNFDRLAYDVLCDLEKKYPITTIVVLAYLNVKSNLCYDRAKTVFPSVLENTPARYAIVKRNQYMIDNANYLACYIDNSISNMYSFVKRAIKKNLKIINLGKFDVRGLTNI